MVMLLKYIELAEGSKKPVAGERTPSDDPEVIAEWKQKGLLTGSPNGIIVRDYDKEEGLELAREEMRTRRELFKVLVRTPNGLHVYLKQPAFEVPNSVKVNGQPVDHRGTGGYVVAAGSTVNGKVYEFIPGYELKDINDLPEFPKDWLPTIKAVLRKAIIDVRKYVMKIESVKGQNGSGGLVRAAARCRDGGLSEAEATVLLLEWNDGPTVSLPKWTADKIARAVTRVYSKGG